METKENPGLGAGDEVTTPHERDENLTSSIADRSVTKSPFDELFPLRAQAIVSATDQHSLVIAIQRYAGALMFVRHVQRRQMDNAREIVTHSVEQYRRRSPARRSINQRMVNQIVTRADELAGLAVGR
ncbi:MAG: hypothetical protein ABIP11_06790 [Luteimonas sp.]